MQKIILKFKSPVYEKISAINLNYTKSSSLYPLPHHAKT